MKKFEDKNLYPHEQLWNVMIDVLTEECPIYQSLAMILYSMIALLFITILPYFFIAIVTVMKIEFPIVDSTIIFWFRASWYIAVFMFILGKIEFWVGIIRWAEKK